MRSISEIINLVVDGVVTTKAQAKEIIEEEITARINICNMKEPEARKNLVDALGWATAGMNPKHADQLMTLFNTQHPIWGRTHPAPEEALRLGEKYAERRLNKENDGK
jgi:hypothetical protein